MKVLVKEQIADLGIEKLKEAGFEVDLAFDMSRDDMLACLSDYDGLIVRSATQVDKEAIMKGSKLKVIGRAGIGVDNIDIMAATKRGIIVANAPQSNIISAAEHALALLMTQARMIVQATNSMKNGKWEKSKFMGIELNDKVMGVLGLGRIGTLVASRARGLGMKVVAYDPYVSSDRFKQIGIEVIDNIADFFKVCDVITVHLPKAKETLGLIGKKEFAMMKDGVRIINTSRGGIVDEQALADAIKDGKVAGAGIDVFTEEPYTKGPLLELDSVIVTPHIAASTIEAQDKAGVIVAEQVIAALKGDFVSNAVNVAAVAPETVDILKPFLPLAEVLGKFFMKLAGGQINSLDIEYSGDIATGKSLELLTIAVIKGLLESVVQEPVTYVNAPSLAAERGIEVKESRTTKTCEYVNSITLSKDDFVVSGTLLSPGKMRIMNLFGYDVDVIPSEYMLIVHNEDRPGMIGNIGTTLGKHNVNIARMQFGRMKARGDAISVLNVDEPISEKALKEIEAIPGVMKAKFVDLNI
ncbi:MAG: phosphoglycerate dehydrogenase [Actinomycetota bacterium]|nr:phosphoglycerate dehydrogenase [Actinomycetota bacterium]